MSGQIVHATQLDSVRIVVLGEYGRAITIPVSLILAADIVMRAITLQQDSITIEPVENDATGEQGFEAYLNADTSIAYGVTAWGALTELADKLMVE